MQALRLQNGRLDYVDDYPRPVATGSEALIRVVLAGICATDLELVRGYANFSGVPGHEFVGVVDSAEEARWIGRRVVGSINIGCGCHLCRQHGPEHCPRRRALGIHGHDGAFADYLVLPVANLHEVPAYVPDEEAVFAEPLAAALRIREQLPLPLSSRIGVLGPGRLGLLIGQVMQQAGNQVTMLARSRESLALPSQLKMEVALSADLEEDAFDIVVEATGNPSGLAEALRLTRPLGTLVMKSTYQGEVNVDLTKLVVGEITVIGSRCGEFRPAIDLLADRCLDLPALIDAEFTLAEGLDAFAHAASTGVRKVLLRP